MILSLILNPAHRRRVALALKESESVLAGTLSETNSEMTQVPGQTPLGWMDEGISEREAATRSMITRPKSIASAVGRERDVDLEE